MYCQTFDQVRDRSNSRKEENVTYLGLAGYGSDPTHFSALERVDYATFPDVGISHESDRYLLLVGMEL